MPQLDKVSFLSQFFWLCIFFGGFYIFQLKYFLPKMSRILKFRKKRVNESSALLFQQENNKVRNSSETVLENLFKNSKKVFKDSSLKEDSWFSKQTSFFQKKFKNANRSYFKSIVKNNLSNLFAIRAAGFNLVSSGFDLNKIDENSRENNYTNLSNKIFLSMSTSVISRTDSVIKYNSTSNTLSALRP